MNKKSIEDEAKRISNELLKNNKYNESFDNLINSLINKKYINSISTISYNVTKIMSSYIEIVSINPFVYNYYKNLKKWDFFIFLGDFAKQMDNKIYRR